MQSGLQLYGKNLYQSPQFGIALTAVLNFAKTNLKFIEIVKTMFQQKGYVSAGLKANVKLKNVKITFGN